MCNDEILWSMMTFTEWSFLICELKLTHCFSIQLNCLQVITQGQYKR